MFYKAPNSKKNTFCEVTCESEREKIILLPCALRSLRLIPGYTYEHKAKELQGKIKHSDFTLQSIWNNMTEQEKEKFKEQCSRDFQKLYPECKVTIEFKSQMTMR